MAAYKWRTKMSELDGRVTALTVALKHLFDLLERKSRPFQSARSCLAMQPPNWSKFPLCPPDINNDSKRTLGALWLPAGGPKDTTI
jgi:hypothetical protein